jgi:hypothetical protein
MPELAGEPAGIGDPLAPDAAGETLDDPHPPAATNAAIHRGAIRILPRRLVTPARAA